MSDGGEKPEGKLSVKRPFYVIFPKIASEGYCCIYGYLNLCRARGETKKSMASWLGVSFWTIKDHYKLLRRGVHTCQKYSECLRPVIEDIHNSVDGLADDLNRADGA